MNIRTLIYSVFGLLWVFLVLFLWSSFRYYTIVHADDPIVPTLRGEMGIATIIRSDLAYEISENESFELENNDIIETPIDGRATIVWPDKSITRLGPKTRIVIEKMYANVGYEKIQIAYTMERGKVWNTIIRSLVWDSYFEVKLPRESIVAWVRGTTFEINLDNAYIHAVDHSTEITQKNTVLELLPGDIIDTENILIQKGKEWLDTAWSEWNSEADALYKSLQSLEIEKRIDALTKDIGKINISNLSRTFLENIEGFEDLSIAKYLASDWLSELKNISESSLLSYYQKLGNLGNTEMKTTLRNSILSVENESFANIRNSLQMHAFWEGIDTRSFSEGTKQYLKNKGIDVDTFTQKFVSGAKNDMTSLRETFSWWLQTLFGF